MQITAVDDAPVVTTSSGSVPGGVQALAVDAGLSLSDADSATLAKATVSITGGFASGQDVLAFANTNAAAFGNIAGSYNGATGVLTLTSSGSSATVAQFQAALRAVTYKNTAAALTAGTRTLSIVADDGTTPSLAATRTVALGAVNHAPSFMLGTGKAVTPVWPGYGWSQTMALQGDGKVVLGGYAFNGTNYDFALARYEADGTLDTSFGSGGRVLTPVGTDQDYASTVTIQTDGKILLGGSASDGTKESFALARYNADGTPDTSFGSGGKVVTAVGSSTDQGQTVTVQADGKILLGGMSVVDGWFKFALARYNADGTLDPSFGSGGKVITAIGQRSDSAYSVTVQADGKILLGGSADTYSGTGDDFVLVRYKADGTLDAGFGDGGKVVTAVGPRGDSAYSVTVQANGKILLGGTTSGGPSADFALVRYKRGRHARYRLRQWRHGRYAGRIGRRLRLQRGGSSRR